MIFLTISLVVFYVFAYHSINNLLELSKTFGICYFLGIITSLIITYKYVYTRQLTKLESNEYKKQLSYLSFLIMGINKFELHIVNLNKEEQRKANSKNTIKKSINNKESNNDISYYSKTINKTFKYENVANNETNDYSFTNTRLQKKSTTKYTTTSDSKNIKNSIISDIQKEIFEYSTKDPDDLVEANISPQLPVRLFVRNIYRIIGNSNIDEDAFYWYLINGVICTFFASEEQNIKYIVRNYDNQNDSMIPQLNMSTSPNPREVSLKSTNPVSASYNRSFTAIQFSEFEEFFTDNYVESDFESTDTITICLLSENSKPLKSFTIEVFGEENKLKLTILNDLNIFNLLKDVICEKIGHIKTGLRTKTYINILDSIKLEGILTVNE